MTFSLTTLETGLTAGAGLAYKSSTPDAGNKVSTVDGGLLKTIGLV
jgi:hypothetical protein